MGRLRFAYAGFCGIAALTALAVPRSCFAEPSGGAWGPVIYFEIGAIIGVPTGVACLLAEAVLPRRRMPVWLTAAATLVGVAVFALALSSDPRQGAFASWLLVPALAVIALRGWVPGGLLRLGIGWVAAIAMLVAVRARYVDNASLLFGGAAASLLLWSATLLILIVLRVGPPGWETVDLARLAAVRRRIESGLDVAGRELRRSLGNLGPAEAGLLWWIGSASAIYFGTAAIIAAGILGGGTWVDVEIARVIDLFGLAPPRAHRPMQLWWSFGLPWSLIAAGAVWGLAGGFGLFEIGRLRGMRLAAIVFGLALLVWTASIIVETSQIRAREEQAAGLRR